MNWDWKHLSLPELGAPVLTRGATVATYLMLALLAYSGARLTWMLWPGAGTPVPGQTPPPSTPAQNATPMMSNPLALAQVIAGRHLFGLANAPVSSAGQVIPETALSLTLRGVFASGDQRAARAIIADPGGKEDYYAIGTQLPGGAVLKEIHKDHVVISRNERYETLRLPQQTLESAAAMAPVMAPGETPPLSNMRDAVAQDPRVLTSLVQGEPVRENNRIIGFRIQPGRDAGALVQFGLQPGDVVTAINGTRLEDPAGRMELMRNLPNMAEVNVDIIRNGVPRSFVVNMDQ